MSEFFDDGYARYRPNEQALPAPKPAMSRKELVGVIKEQLPSFSVGRYRQEDPSNAKYAAEITNNIITALETAGVLNLRKG